MATTPGDATSTIETDGVSFPGVYGQGHKEKLIGLICLQAKDFPEVDTQENHGDGSGLMGVSLGSGTSSALGFLAQTFRLQRPVSKLMSVKADRPTRNANRGCEGSSFLPEPLQDTPAPRRQSREWERQIL